MGRGAEEQGSNGEERREVMPKVVVHETITQRWEKRRSSVFMSVGFLMSMGWLYS
jgi:hypothetical protein